MSDLAKIEEIYHAALEKLPAEREVFLAEVCGDDGELRREVESLLKFDEEAANFIESPPEDIAAEIFAEQRDGAGLVGKTLNHYRVLSILGAGGMGEVYLAEDIKLGRKVALKILPSQFSANPERHKRFEREARAASALNHPNIITIYGIEKAKEINFIVTEYVEGETLRELIERKPLTANEVVEICIQIAGALESAHTVGIVHRDIKPANIMIRHDGLVKVLDFGLAKLTSAESAEIDREAETRELFKTKSGMIMGTVNYMSPEQALGERIDARTDIFSFGTVLYEMLTGTPPFAGTSDAAIYNGIINKNPPSVSKLNPKIPPPLDKITNLTLAKKPEERYQTVKDLRLDLQALSSELSASSGRFSFDKVKSSSIPSPRATAVGLDVSTNPSVTASSFGFTQKKIALPVAAVVLLAVLGFGYFKYFNKTALPQTAQNFNFTQFTSGGNATQPSLSPDGKTVVFASLESGNWDIYFQRVGGANAINLTKDSPSDDTQPAYSPNGDMVAFHSDRDGGGIFLMGATGENLRKISDSGYYPAWSPDSREIVFSNGDFLDPTDRGFFPASLWILNIASGEKRELTKGDAVQPAWSPSGERIAFWGIDEGGIRDIKTISARGGEVVTITNDAALDWNPVWSADGKYLYFASNRGGSMNFWRVALDEKTGALQGAPEPFTTPSVYSQNLAFSSNGKFLAYVQKVNSSNIIQVEFNPKTETIAKNTTKITQGTRYDRNPWVSPDGEWIAFDAIKDKQEDLFIMKRDGSNVRQLTNDINKDRAARWSPDGKKLIFYSDRSGRYENWTVNLDGSGLTQISSDSEPYALLSFWSPDGTKILQNRTKSYPKIFDAGKTFAEQTPFQIPSNTSSDIWIMAFDWSPDGNKIASLRMGTKENISGVVVYSLASQTYEASADFGECPVWLNDSRRLIFVEKNKIFLLDMQTAKTKELMSVQPTEILQGITISPDNRHIYFPLQKQESNIWLASVE